MTTISVSNFNPSLSELNSLTDDLPEFEPTQAICGRNINPTKLISLLRTKFGAGAYDIEV
jgi:hypothetical protein